MAVLTTTTQPMSEQSVLDYDFHQHSALQIYQSCVMLHACMHGWLVTSVPARIACAASVWPCISAYSRGVLLRYSAEFLSFCIQCQPATYIHRCESKPHKHKCKQINPISRQSQSHVHHHLCLSRTYRSNGAVGSVVDQQLAC